MRRKMRFISLVCLVFAAFLYAAISANSYVNESMGLIEVCANGTVYVPAGTKLVKCNGIVRRVIRSGEMLAAGQEDCRCPKCCSGDCFIPVLDEMGNIRFIWLSC